MEGTKDSTVVLRKLRRRKDKDDSNYDKLNPREETRETENYHGYKPTN